MAYVFHSYDDMHTHMMQFAASHQSIAQPENEQCENGLLRKKAQNTTRA